METYFRKMHTQKFFKNLHIGEAVFLSKIKLNAYYSRLYVIQATEFSENAILVKA